MARGQPPGRIRRADQRPRQAVRAHRLYRAVEYVRKSCDLAQWRLRQQRFPDRRADHRPPLRRSRRTRHGQGVRGPARSAKAVAEPAEEVTLAVIPGCAEGAGPESIGPHTKVVRWIPGSRQVARPGMTSTK